MSSRHIVVAITGASGAIYGVRLCRELLRAGARITVLVSPAGKLVLREECGLDWEGDEATVSQRLREHFHAGEEQLFHYAGDNFMAPVASGSSAPDAMVICPCSMGTLSRVAFGNAGNLLERCADVMLKERRTLVLVPRETPLSEIHLENMLRLARMGVRMVPPIPAFYHHPRTIDDLVDFAVGKVLDALRVDHELFRRWGSGGGKP
ncbi:MAG TPA: flavin prenyltransferase UbiX [Geobacteraceae bacterium]